MECHHQESLGVPNTTNRYLIEPLSGCMHPKVMLSSRLVKLRNTMASSSKLSVKLFMNLAKADWRTVMCSNLGNIQRELGANQMNPYSVKKLLKYFDMPAQQSWRAPCLSELMDVKSGTGKIENFSTDDISYMINFLCSS